MSPQTLQPSTTSAHKPSATNSVTGNGNVFTRAGSPPLVLAFLSIGLFSAAMVFVFGWRRIQLRRWRFTVPINIDVELPVIQLEPPKLWDLRNGGKFAWGQGGAGPEDDVNWVNLMPLSAKPVLHSPTVGERHQRSMNSFSHAIPTLDSLSWWNHKRAPLRNDSEKKSVEEDLKVTMQVAVTIVLPSPRYPVHIKNRNTSNSHRGKDKERQSMPDYCIGMHECSWH